MFAKNFHVKAVMKTSVLLSWEIPENYNSAMPFKVSCFLTCKKISLVKVEGAGHLGKLLTKHTDCFESATHTCYSLCGFHITD